MDLVGDAFGTSFAQRGLLLGLLTACCCALAGSWVVVRGLAFFGEALGHGVLPGIALALSWGVDPTLGALVAAALVVGLVAGVHQASGLTDSTATGLTFSGMLALGVVVISRSPTFAGDLETLLFGNVLGATVEDVRFQALVLGATLLAVVLLRRPLVTSSFHARKARTLGLRPQLAHLVVLSLVALAVVGSFRTTGTLLVVGLLLAPPATATLLVHRMWAVAAIACAFGSAAVPVGLVLSYHLDLAAGATIVLVAVLAFFVVALARRGVVAVRHQQALAPPVGMRAS